MKQWGAEHEVVWGEHHMPHDGNRKDLFLENGREGVLAEHGVFPNFVDRPVDKWKAVEAARNVFSECDFDEAGCGVGLSRLANYRKEWDEKKATWKNKPYHDDNSNAADGFMTFASGYSAPVPMKRKKRRQPPSGWAA